MTLSPSRQFPTHDSDDARRAVDPELLDVFRQEAEGHLHAIRSNLPALGQGGEAVQVVRRAAHTLKGSAAMVGFQALTRLAHRMEDLLDRIFEGLVVTPHMADLLNVSADRLDDLAVGQEDAAALDGLYARYDLLLGAGETAPAGRGSAAGDPSAAREPEAADAGRPAREAFVRAPLHGLDALARLVGELIVLRTAFEQRLTAGPAVGQLDDEIEDLLSYQARIISELHDRLMHIRLVPFGTLVARLRRTVRQVAERSRKPVDLTLEGEAVALDKAVLEDMAEPLMHLLRNAVDHGIEPADLRRKRGKPERGGVIVRAAHEGGQVVLRISDDGGGVDVTAVRAKAVERGFATPEEAARLTEPELFAFVFQPGFSTALKVSETSGRGLGLDVVRECVERRKGSVTLTSRPGEGTTFVIRLPMTVAVTRALLVRACGQTFALPAASVVRIARVGADGLEARGGIIRLGEETHSCVTLGDVLGLRPRTTAEAGRPAALLIEAGERKTAVIVDDVQGAREVVVKNLGAHLQKVHGIGGATLTGDGAVVLILNPTEFLAPPQRPVRPPAAPSARPLSVLVVDDSPSIRKGLTNLIECMGWVAREARDGQDGLEVLEAGLRPDVMLLDVDMPRMNGYELLAAVKEAEEHRAVPVVMVTSRAGAHDRRKAERLGAAGYVVKPYRVEELLEAIRRAVAPAPAPIP